MDFPPVGSTSSFEQTKHLTLLELFPNVICSFLHFGHLILINLLLDSLNNSAIIFHLYIVICSEEIWQDPLKISTDFSPEEYNEIKTGWDFLIDIDSPYLDYSKIAAELIINALKYNGVENIGIKFSGSKGFHLIVPWQAFPEELNEQKTKNMFPEWPRLIAQYVQDMIKEQLDQRVFAISDTSLMKKEEIYESICKNCNEQAVEQKITKYVCTNPRCRTEIQSTKSVKKTLRCQFCKGDLEKVNEDEYATCNTCKINSMKNPEQFEKRMTAKQHIDSVDIILVASRHLFRAPYSLHEKTALCSAVLEPNVETIRNFSPDKADPLKAQIKNFLPSPKKDEAKELLLQAIDHAKKKGIKPKKKFTGTSINVKELTIEESMFPDCIIKILKGIKKDGRKRALFILLGFFVSLELPKEYIEEKVEAWNKKNYHKLKQGYIQSQIDWFLKNKIMPPNCDKPSYKELGASCQQCISQGIKNPVSYTIRQAMKRPNKNLNKSSKP